MSTQDPYGSQDQPREQRTGSSADSSGGYGQQAPSGYSQQPPAGYQGQPPAGGYGGYDRPAPRNGLGIAALVLGILALLSGFILVGGLLGLVAIVLGIIGARRAKRGEATNRGVAITGVVLGVLGVVVAVIAAIFFGWVGSQALNCQDLITQGASEQQINECLADQFGVPASQLDS